MNFDYFVVPVVYTLLRVILWWICSVEHMSKYLALRLQV